MKSTLLSLLILGLTLHCTLSQNVIYYHYYLTPESENLEKVLEHNQVIIICKEEEIWIVKIKDYNCNKRWGGTIEGEYTCDNILNNYELLAQIHDMNDEQNEYFGDLQGKLVFECKKPSKTEQKKIYNSKKPLASIKFGVEFLNPQLYSEVFVEDKEDGNIANEIIEEINAKLRAIQYGFINIETVKPKIALDLQSYFSELVPAVEHKIEFAFKLKSGQHHLINFVLSATVDGVRKYYAWRIELYSNVTIKYLLFFDILGIN